MTPILIIAIIFIVGLFYAYYHDMQLMEEQLKNANIRIKQLEQRCKKQSPYNGGEVFKK